ncbi:hypothetical protein A3Q56_07492 [Intoshia linei]|uniref:Uncharacterized protein n=1 Tax=Intoshia linei TaxID=1819745 RepID=A0A177ASH8_9BILA|nr:hypothetical protein A3Q56_07492 [Intoshia linei]
MNYNLLDDMKASGVFERTKDIESTLSFCLLSTKKICPMCGREMFFPKKACIDEFEWRCSVPCKKILSIRNGSFFEKSFIFLKFVWRRRFCENTAFRSIIEHMALVYPK